jgi:hypothetical protein
MDFDLLGDDHPYRKAMSEWLEAHPEPSGRELAEAGYVAPHWPTPWGLDADPIQQLVIDAELQRSGVSRPMNPIGIGWAGPTILHAGTPEQKDRYLMPLLAGEEVWCQLFSEPQAGSDLADRPVGGRDGDEYVVNGQKIWTSLAQFSAYGILIARTDHDQPNHQRVSYFNCQMQDPGIEIRPIIEMTGGPTFNEVFLTDVRRAPRPARGSKRSFGPSHGSTSPTTSARSASSSSMSCPGCPPASCTSASCASSTGRTARSTSDGNHSEVLRSAASNRLRHDKPGEPHARMDLRRALGSRRRPPAPSAVRQAG